MSNTIKFVLAGCDISFIAEAPEDITLKQLLAQCDKIKPHWCTCGIYSYKKVYGNSNYNAEITIGYDSIKNPKPKNATFAHVVLKCRACGAWCGGVTRRIKKDK